VQFLDHVVGAVVRWTTMTSQGLRSPYVERLAMLSIVLTRVVSELPTERSSTLCAHDRRTIACPLPCYCGAPDHRSVRCDAGGLTSVPASVWSVVPVSLNLSFNSIAEWTGIDVTSADDEHVACLGTLILSHSGVTSIRPHSFERLRGLRELLLDHNQIVVLDSAMFVGLRRLELLDVSHNQLVSLPQSLFDELNQLKV